MIHRQGSTLEKGLLSALLEEERITHLIHTAGARTSECASDPKAGFESNVLGTDTVFRAAKNCDSIEKVIYFSSAAVYGAHPAKPTESSDLAPPTPYAITKAASEISALGHTERSNYSTIVLRPGFVVGPHSKGTLPTFLKEALAGQEAKLSFSKRFFLHWAPDLSHAVSVLLGLRTLAKWNVIHPPGIAVTLSELQSAIEDFCSESGVSSKAETSCISDTPFPEDLDQEQFRKLVPNFSATTLLQMIDQIATGGRRNG